MKINNHTALQKKNNNKLIGHNNKLWNNLFAADLILEHKNVERLRGKRGFCKGQLYLFKLSHIIGKIVFFQHGIILRASSQKQKNYQHLLKN